MRLIDPDRLMQDVGRRLAELREARGFTQQLVADELGVSMRHVQAVEAGMKNLTLRSIAAFANAVRSPLAAVFEPPAVSKRKPGRPKKARPPS